MKVEVVNGESPARKQTPLCAAVLVSRAHQTGSQTKLARRPFVSPLPFSLSHFLPTRLREQQAAANFGNSCQLVAALSLRAKLGARGAPSGQTLPVGSGAPSGGRQTACCQNRAIYSIFVYNSTAKLRPIVWGSQTGGLCRQTGAKLALFGDTRSAARLAPVPRAPSARVEIIAAALLAFGQVPVVLLSCVPQQCS